MLCKSFPSKITLRIELPYPKHRKYEIVMFRLERYCRPYIIAAKKAVERLAVCGQGTTPHREDEMK